MIIRIDTEGLAQRRRDHSTPLTWVTFGMRAPWSQVSSDLQTRLDGAAATTLNTPPSSTQRSWPDVDRTSQTRHHERQYAADETRRRQRHWRHE